MGISKTAEIVPTPQAIADKRTFRGLLGNARWRFAATYLLIAVTLLAVYCFPYSESGMSEAWFTSYLRAYAHLAGSVLWLFDHDIVVSGTTIMGRYSLQIVKNCDGVEANILYAAAALAFPAAWQKRAIATIGGVGLLVATNVARICSLYFVGVFWPNRFELFHLEIWPLLLIAVAGLEFMAWAAWMQRPDALAVKDVEATTNAAGAMSDAAR